MDVKCHTRTYSTNSTVTRHFDQKEYSFGTHNSSLEGATKLKWCHNASLEMPFQTVSYFAGFENFPILAENHGCFDL